ncbi:hypothetical protein C6497_14280 [Candidatus Poribacteria bacterium]|nr:MAG: hypothetical protein C6497_14280 [Candidatus Poribacteria bacterium]
MILVLLITVFFISLTEFYSSGIENQNTYTVNPGSQTYSLFINSMLLITFLVPRHAVETIRMEQSENNIQNVGIGNFAYLKLSKLTDFEILIGKIAAVVIWTLWSVLLLIPIFSLSSYMGGYNILQLAKCGIILTINGILFSIIGCMCGLCFPTITAKGVSYGIILFITLIPILPFFPFNIDTLDILSSLSSISSILYSGESHLWLYNSCLYLILSILLFPILIILFRKTIPIELQK